MGHWCFLGNYVYRIVYTTGTFINVFCVHFGVFNEMTCAFSVPPMENKLAELRKSKGFSQTALADAIGTSRSQIVKLESGERRLSDVWLAKIAPVLGVTQGQILGEGSSMPIGSRILNIIGEVQAGAYSEAAEFDLDDYETVAVQNSDFPPGANVFMLRAVGDSMDQADIPDGSLLFCVTIHDFMQFWRDIRTGDRVVVHRVRNDGFYESTVKEIIFGENGETFLKPHSSNPRHETIYIPSRIAQGDGIVDDHEIHVHAVVLGRYYQPFV